MILDPNGMPILQPAVDNAETATFNTAFAAIGSAIAALEAKHADTGWITPTLNKGTNVSGNDFGYRRLGPVGAAVVYLRGRVDSLSSSDLVFTLPFGYRLDTSSTISDNVFLPDDARVNIEGDGKITALTYRNSLTFTGISFIANY